MLCRWNRATPKSLQFRSSRQLDSGKMRGRPGIVRILQAGGHRNQSLQVPNSILKPGILPGRTK